MGIDTGGYRPLRATEEKPSLHSNHSSPATHAAIELDHIVHASSNDQQTSESDFRPKRKTEAWRFCVAASSAVALAVMIFNITLAVWASTKYGTEDGVGTAIEGSCSLVNVWSLIFKLVINILSSILLSVSNYAMQCMSSPSREDLNRAHAKGDWMDIGISGVRNLVRIRRLRAILWLLLACTSIPIHLLYNSTVFRSLSTNTYEVVVANKDFLEGHPFQHQYWFSDPNQAGSHAVSLNRNETLSITGIQQAYRDNTTSHFQNLSNAACLDTYGVNTLAGYSNVIVVTDWSGPNANDSLLYVENVHYANRSNTPYSWICHSLDHQQSESDTSACDVVKAKDAASGWTINGQRVEYCLAQEADSHCRLQFSLAMMIAVIICNAIKCVAMFLAFWSHKDAIIVTFGDAIASYLNCPDDTTRGRCMIGMEDVRQELPTWISGKEPRKWNATAPSPQHAVPHNRRWFCGASKRRWYLTYIFIVLCLGAVGIFLGIGVTGFGKLTGNQNMSWAVGFGEPDLQASITHSALPQRGATGLTASVLISNLPQTVLSFIYLIYNGLFTCMLLAAEWNEYSQKRQVLRVSNPKGQQMSTRWLSLPVSLKRIGLSRPS